jgi:hypothetical protein
MPFEPQARVVTHPPAAAAAGSPPAATGVDVAVRAPHYWSEPTIAASGTSVAAPDAPSVHRITEHVLHTLDQRLVAARERLSLGVRT